MKQILLLAFLFAVSFSLSAQIKKGTFMAEGGINLSGNWNYDSKPFTEGFGISFGTSDYYSKDRLYGGDKFWSSSQTINYSLSPRLGYSLFRNFVVGADFKYRKNTFIYSSDSKDQYRVELYGIFARKYFGSKKITPFIESGLGFGLSKMSTPEISSGGARWVQIERRNEFYYSGAVGVTYSIIPKFKINLMVKGQHSEERPINTENYSTSHTKTMNFDSALVLSFSYFLHRKIKE